MAEDLIGLQKYRQGSFRGVPFETRSHSLGSGRNKKDHEFPQREKNRSEDLGRKIRSFSLELFVIGEDYFQKRNALIEALDTEGSGELIHPYHGRKIVQVGPYTQSETDAEAGVARFSVEFTETADPSFPAQDEDQAEKTEVNADAIKESSKSFFEKAFDVLGKPGFVADQAGDSVRNLTQTLTSSVAKFTNITTELALEIRELEANVETLIRTPDILAERIQSALDLLLDQLSGADDDETAGKIYGNFTSYGEDFETIGNTPSKVAAKNNDDALIDLARNSALANQSKSHVRQTYNSTADALLTRENIVEDIQTQLFRVSDDDLFQNLKDVQESLTRALPGNIENNLIELELKQTVPALLISYRLFGDLEKEDEIVFQNNVFHPGFVPGGTTIGVSSG